MKHEMISKDENVQAVELSDAALEKVAGGVVVTGGKKVDPKKTCMHYACASCGGARGDHALKCDGPLLNCCGRCAHVKHGDDGCYYCFLCDRK